MIRRSGLGRVVAAVAVVVAAAAVVAGIAAATVGQVTSRLS